MTEKVDFKKSLPTYRAKRGQFSFIDVPDMQYLMVDGQGDPNLSPNFRRAIEVLYPVAYALKFASKSELGRDYVVPPLEGLWWADDMSAFTTALDRTKWRWTMMILTPDWLDESRFVAAVSKVAAKGWRPELDKVRLETLSEGLSLQTLHVGPFTEEAVVLAHLHNELIPAHGVQLSGVHHEIYLSDFRTAAPGKLRTILRQPVVTQA